MSAAAAFAGQVIGQSVIVLLVFIFMLSAAVTTSLSDKFEEAISSRAANRISDLTQGVQQYISITTLINLAVGVGNAILLLILGVPFAVFWGILAWLMGYIPTVGFWIAMIPPLVLAWTRPRGRFWPRTSHNS